MGNNKKLHQCHLSDCCVTLKWTIFKQSWWEQVTLWDDDSDVYFVLGQHTKLDFYSASSLKQQYFGRHVSSLWHIILILLQPVFALAEKQQIPILSSLVKPDLGLEPKISASHLSLV